MISHILTTMSPKQRAADAALAYVRSNTVIGLGTGSTADLFVRALAAALKDGRLTNVKGVPTSIATEKLAAELGVPYVSLRDYPKLDLAIDGADEIDPKLNLIKGLGGALLREKMIAQSAQRMIVIADESKVVQVLGVKGPLPIEVVQFAHETQMEFLRELGGNPVLRRHKDGSPFVTDNGNYIYDTKFAKVKDPAELDKSIQWRSGVVDTGLFVDVAAIAIIGGDNGVRKIERAK